MFCKRFFLALLCLLIMAGHGFAQTSSQNSSIVSELTALSRLHHQLGLLQGFATATQLVISSQTGYSELEALMASHLQNFDEAAQVVLKAELQRLAAQDTSLAHFQLSLQTLLSDKQAELAVHLENLEDQENTQTEKLNHLRQQIDDANQTLTSRHAELKQLTRDFATALKQLSFAHADGFDSTIFEATQLTGGIHRDYLLNRLGSLLLKAIQRLRHDMHFDPSFKPHFTVTGKLENANSSSAFAIDFRRQRRLLVTLEVLAKTATRQDHFHLGEADITVDREGNILEEARAALFKLITDNRLFHEGLARMQAEELSRPQAETELAEFRNFLDQKCRDAGIF